MKQAQRILMEMPSISILLSFFSQIFCCVIAAVDFLIFEYKSKAKKKRKKQILQKKSSKKKSTKETLFTFEILAFFRFLLVF